MSEYNFWQLTMNILLFAHNLMTRRNFVGFPISQRSFTKFMKFPNVSLQFLSSKDQISITFTTYADLESSRIYFIQISPLRNQESKFNWNFLFFTNLKSKLFIDLEYFVVLDYHVYITVWWVLSFSYKNVFSIYFSFKIIKLIPAVNKKNLIYSNFFYISVVQCTGIHLNQCYSNKKYDHYLHHHSLAVQELFVLILTTRGWYRYRVSVSAIGYRKLFWGISDRYRVSNTLNLRFRVSVSRLKSVPRYWVSDTTKSTRYLIPAQTALTSDLNFFFQILDKL